MARPLATCALALAGLLLGGSAAVQAADAPAATFTVRQLTPETALRAVQAALAHCRGQGYQVAAVVVDRAGLPQALLRDRLAGAHTRTWPPARPGRRSV
jgi:hypothetical protein